MKEVNIMIGRFQPLTKGHMKCVEQAYESKNLPTILCMIDTPDTKVDKKHPFPSSVLMPMYEDMFKGNPMVEDICLVKNADIVKIGEMLFEKGYQIASWTCGTDRFDSYKKMSDKYAEQAHLTPDFEMMEIKRSDEDISATKVREAILNDDYDTYLKLAYVSLKSHLNKKKNYDILKDCLSKVY